MQTGGGKAREHFSLAASHSTHRYYHVWIEESITQTLFELQFKADRLQMIVVSKKYICVATVHQ